MLKKLLFISLVISIIVNINNLSAETTILVPLKKPSLTDEEIVKKLTQNILVPIKKPKKIKEIKIGLKIGRNKTRKNVTVQQNENRVLLETQQNFELFFVSFAGNSAKFLTFFREFCWNPAKFCEKTGRHLHYRKRWEHAKVVLNYFACCSVFASNKQTSSKSHARY